MRLPRRKEEKVTVADGKEFWKRRIINIATQKKFLSSREFVKLSLEWGNLSVSKTIIIFLY